MVFDRHNHRVERRRRVLLEETGAGPQAPVSGTPQSGAATPVATGPVRSYSEAALSPRQPRVVDLIPARCWTIAVLTLLACSGAVAMVALYGHLALGYCRVTIAQVPAVDLAAPGNIADWFSSCLLLATAGLGILIYQIRRHRVDDYRGRYRMWHWVVPLTLAASVNQVADLSTSLRTTALVLAGIPDYPDAALIWAVSASLGAAVVGIRLTIEMRACPLAVVTLSGALASYLAVKAIELNWILESMGTFRVMAVGGLTLAVHISLFLTMCLYARHVLRDASGMVSAKPRPVAAKTRPRRPRNEPASPPAKLAEAAQPAAPSRPVSSKLRIDAPHTAAAAADVKVPPAQPLPKSKPSPNPKPNSNSNPKTAETPLEVPNRRPPAPTGASKAMANASADERDLDEDGGDDKLSKTERRRLRKLHRRDRQQS
ncbi:MAG: hypothetical protein ACYC0X_02555 [Pirellulaceae bacterium]